jgi:hypothetical protein
MNAEASTVENQSNYVATSGTVLVRVHYEMSFTKNYGYAVKIVAERKCEYQVFWPQLH